MRAWGDFLRDLGRTDDDGGSLTFERGADAFSVLGAHRYPYGVSLTGEGEAARVRVMDLTPSVMDALGGAP